MSRSHPITVLGVDIDQSTFPSFFRQMGSLQLLYYSSLGKRPLWFGERVALAFREQVGKLPLEVTSKFRAINDAGTPEAQVDSSW